MASTMAQPCSNLRFLVVEDHPVQRRMICALLQGLGAAQIHEAADGAEALEIIRNTERPTDIVITDLSMPGIDGLQLIRNLAAAPAPVSLIIASAEKPEVLREVAKAARSYRVQILGSLSKPVSAAKLHPLIEAHRNAKLRRSMIGFRLDELTEALQADEFVPAFEPRVNLATAEIIGVHVRVRWKHSLFGFLESEVFLHSAQQFGLHDRITWSVIDNSIRFLSTWLSKGMKLHLSVDMAASLLGDPTAASQLQALCDHFGVRPNRVTVCARDDFHDVERAVAIANLIAIRQARFGLAAENFGIGKVWDQLPEHILTEQRISRALVSGANTDSAPEANIILALDSARRLGIPASAEGIESLDEWNRLQDWGCEIGQGPFVGPLLSADAVLPWLAGTKVRTFALGALGTELSLSTGLPEESDPDPVS